MVPWPCRTKYNHVRRQHGKRTIEEVFAELNNQVLVQRICAIDSTIALKMVKVSEVVQRKLIPYRSIIGSGAFRKIKYFGGIPRQLLCVQGFDHKVKIPEKHIFAVLLIHNINPTAEKALKTDSK